MGCRRRGGLRRAFGVAVGALAAAGFGGAGAAVAGSDPGLLLEIDADRFELRARDLRNDAEGPAVRVATGSPGARTPTGQFAIHQVVLNPSWRAHWSQPRLGPGLDTPMGVAKIPFAGGGSIALHGGGDPLVLGKPVSGGCVRASDGDLLRVIAWLHERGALGEPDHRSDGEVVRPFRRPARILVHAAPTPSSAPTGADSQVTQ